MNRTTVALWALQRRSTPFFAFVRLQKFCEEPKPFTPPFSMQKTPFKLQFTLFFFCIKLSHQSVLFDHQILIIPKKISTDPLSAWFLLLCNASLWCVYITLLTLSTCRVIRLKSNKCRILLGLVTPCVVKTVDLIVLLDSALAVEISLISGFNITHLRYRW